MKTGTSPDDVRGVEASLPRAERDPRHGHDRPDPRASCPSRPRLHRRRLGRRRRPAPDSRCAALDQGSPERGPPTRAIAVPVGEVRRGSSLPRFGPLPRGPQPGMRTSSKVAARTWSFDDPTARPEPMRLFPEPRGLDPGTLQPHGERSERHLVASGASHVSPIPSSCQSSSTTRAAAALSTASEGDESSSKAATARR